MRSPAIAPALVGPPVRKIRSEGPRLRARSSPAAQLLKDATVEPLSTVDTTRTLLGTLLRRGHDVPFNRWIIATTERLERPVHVVGAVLFTSGMLLAFVPDATTRTVLTCVAVLTGSVLWCYVAASLSWDMLLLIVRTFEFWFLLAINTHNLWLWVSLFRDQRALGFGIMGANFALTFCTDANIYARRVFVRLTVFASPGLLVMIVATALRVPPDIQSSQYRVAGLTVDTIDLLLNGNLTIAYFTSIRAYRSQHLLFSRTPIQRIVCDMYFPSCHLVHQSASRYSSVMTSAVANAAITGGHLELIQNPSARGIDAARCLAPWPARWIQQSVLATRLVLPIGIVGLALTCSGFALLTVDMNHWKTLPSCALGTIEVLALAATLLFVAISAAHWQPILAKRICFELDVWFVVAQLTLVSLGVCDAFQWTARPTFLIATAWLWALWVLFLDAVPAATRRRLAFSKPFAVLVILCLVTFPGVLSFWLYFSPAHELIQNRLLLSVPVGRHPLNLDVKGFTSSKLCTLWVWLCRFLWRELFRPRDAFKVIKRRVFYRVQPL